jgi:hypothetical protein
VIDSVHFRDMLQEREIRMEWVLRTLDQPDRTEERADGTKHYLRKIAERDLRWLRVVVNVASTPPKRVTAFFDRRLRTTP